MTPAKLDKFKLPGTLFAGATSLLRGMAQTPGSDTHDDFAPQFKASPGASVAEQIQQDIKEHKVFVYMKVPPGPLSVVMQAALHASHCTDVLSKESIAGQS